jgi:hypothetical protein
MVALDSGERGRLYLLYVAAVAEHCSAGALEAGVARVVFWAGALLVGIAPTARELARDWAGRMFQLATGGGPGCRFYWRPWGWWSSVG